MQVGFIYASAAAVYWHHQPTLTPLVHCSHTFAHPPHCFHPETSPKCSQLDPSGSVTRIQSVPWGVINGVYPNNSPVNVNTLNQDYFNGGCNGRGEG